MQLCRGHVGSEVQLAVWRDGQERTLAQARGCKIWVDVPALIKCAE